MKTPILKVILLGLVLILLISLFKPVYKSTRYIFFPLFSMFIKGDINHIEDLEFLGATGLMLFGWLMILLSLIIVLVSIFKKKLQPQKPIKFSSIEFDQGDQTKIVKRMN